MKTKLEKAINDAWHVAVALGWQQRRDAMGELRANYYADHERHALKVLRATIEEVKKLENDVERLRTERDALKAAAREYLTTSGAALNAGSCFVRQAMQKLDVLAFDRSREPAPTGLERLHEELQRKS